MKKVILVFPLILGIWGFTFLEKDQFKILEYNVHSLLSESSVLAGKTGAPSEPNCTQCHGGTASSGSVVNTLAFSDVNDEYTPGQTYTFNLDVASTIMTGFQMTGLDGSNVKAGTFIAGANTNLLNNNNRQYINHSSGGVASWAFDWTAPTLGVGDITFYLATNKANGNGITSGDQIYLTEYTITQVSGVGIVEPNEGILNLRSSYDINMNAINLSFFTSGTEEVNVKIQNLEGRLIQSNHFGKAVQGANSQSIILKRDLPTGIYLITLQLGGKYFTEKIFI